MGAYRMRFLWPDEIDGDRARYDRLLKKWGSDEAIDDMEHAFGSIFWQMPERVPCVALDAQTGQEALEEAATRWQRHPRIDGRVGYLIFEIRVLFEMVNPVQNAAPTYDGAPTDMLPVVRRDHNGRRSLDLLRWGLVPWWAKDIKIGARSLF